MTDQPTPEGMPAADGDMPAADMPAADMPAADMPAADPPPLAPLVAAAANPPAPPMPAAAPMPPAGPPPAVAWQAAPAAVQMKGQRTGLALVAGILLLLLAIAGGLFGLLIAVLGSTFVANFGDIGEIPGYTGDPAKVLTGVVVFVGIIIIAYSFAYLLAGIGVIRNSTWARVLGIVISIISGLIWLNGINSSSGAAFSVVLLAIHAYIVVALVLFWRRKASA